MTRQKGEQEQEYADDRSAVSQCGLEHWHSTIKSFDLLELQAIDQTLLQPGFAQALEPPVERLPGVRSAPSNVEDVGLSRVRSLFLHKLTPRHER